LISRKISTGNENPFFCFVISSDDCSFLAFVRTFPEHSYFTPSGGGDESLRRILQAFALHHPSIGYCQSLNFIAGMMLIFMSEEEAFWLLLTVVEKLLPPDYYTKSMVGTYVDQFVLAHIIKKYLPNIHTTLEKNHLQLPLITVQWFMCLFVNTLRPEVTLRIWDMFLNEGSKVLFRIAAALFKLHEAQLLKVTDAGDLFTTLRKLGKDVVDADILITAAYKSYQPNNPVNRPSSLGRPNSTGSHHSDKILAQVSAAGKPSSGNSSPVKASPMSSFKKHLFEITPRLKTTSSSGKVPHVLQGVGLAHVGPIAERPRIQRYESVTDIATYVFDKSDSSFTNVELDQEMLRTANQMSDKLLSTEIYEIKDKKIDGEDDSNVTTSDENTPREKEKKKLGKPVKENSLAPEVMKELPLDEATATPEKTKSAQKPPAVASPEKTQLSSDSYDQAIFTNPNLLLNSVRDSIGGSATTSTYNKTTPSSSFYAKPKRNRKFKPGEFTFTREDIAVWRSTFRPGLQERYERMEKARLEFAKEREKDKEKDEKKKKQQQQQQNEPVVQPHNQLVVHSHTEVVVRPEPLDITHPTIAPTNSTSPSNADSSRGRSSLRGNRKSTAERDVSPVKYDVDHQFEKINF
jgi:hypothetical protein